MIIWMILVSVLLTQLKRFTRSIVQSREYRLISKLN